jgi:hypothetical protein
MAEPSNERYDTLSEALDIIDPQGVLKPGTTAHNSVTEKILSWMDEFDPNDVLRMSKNSRHIFISQWHIWK